MYANMFLTFCFLLNSRKNKFLHLTDLTTFWSPVSANKGKNRQSFKIFLFLDFSPTQWSDKKNK